MSTDSPVRPMGMPNRRIWPWLGGAAVCLVAGYAGMRFRQGPSPAPAIPATPSRKAAPRVEAGSDSHSPSPNPPAEPAARPVETAPAPEAVGGRTQEDWLKLLAALAGEDYARQHPGVLEKLAALLVAHAGDEGWEAGAVAYLARGLEGEAVMTFEAVMAFWERAAEALPGNLAISDKLMRTALVNLGYGQAEPRAKLDALLARQSLRTPKDPQVAWLRAWAAFGDGRSEEAEGFLKAAAGFPAWQEKAGMAELGFLDVRAVLEGPQNPVAKLGVASGIVLPGGSKMRDLVRKTVRSAQALRGRGESERARDLLEAADTIGRGHSDGSRILVSHLAGNAMQKAVVQVLRDQALASGDLAAREEADRRLAALKADRAAVRAWLDSGQRRTRSDWAYTILQRVGLDTSGGGEPRWTEQRAADTALLMTDEDRRQLEQCFHQFVHELDDFRAWKAANPPTP